MHGSNIQLKAVAPAKSNKEGTKDYRELMLERTSSIRNRLGNANN